MWSDNDIDDAFRRLDPAEPDPTPFPLDAWLKLEAGLDQAVIDRAVRHRLWQFFAAEVAVVALVGLGWSLWPASDSALAGAKQHTATATPSLLTKATDTKPRLASRVAAVNVPAATATKSLGGSQALTMPRPVAIPAATTVPTAAPASAASPPPQWPDVGTIRRRR